MRSEQAFSKVRARLAPALIRKSSFFLRAHTTEFEKCNPELTTDAFYCALEADSRLNRKQRRKHINWHLTNWWCSCRSEVQIITAVLCSTGAEIQIYNARKASYDESNAWRKCTGKGATYFLNWMNLLLACCKVDCRRCRFEGRSEGVEIELSGK